MDVSQKRRIATASYDIANIVVELENEGKKRGVTKLRRAIYFLQEAMKAAPNG